MTPREMLRSSDFGLRGLGLRFTRDRAELHKVAGENELYAAERFVQDPSNLWRARAAGSHPEIASNLGPVDLTLPGRLQASWVASMLSSATGRGHSSLDQLHLDRASTTNLAPCTCALTLDG